ncbi:transcriptional regulator, partial [Xanthomonas perforans]
DALAHAEALLLQRLGTVTLAALASEFDALCSARAPSGGNATGKRTRQR